MKPKPEGTTELRKLSISCLLRIKNGIATTNLALWRFFPLPTWGELAIEAYAQARAQFPVLCPWEEMRDACPLCSQSIILQPSTNESEPRHFEVSCSEAVWGAYGALGLPLDGQGIGQLGHGVVLRVQPALGLFASYLASQPFVVDLFHCWSNLIR